MSYCVRFLSLDVNTPLQFVWLSLGVNTPLQLDLLVCFGFHSVGVNTPLQWDLLQFVLAVDQREHTFTVGSLTVCFDFLSV